VEVEGDGDPSSNGPKSNMKQQKSKSKQMNAGFKRKN
jgi:hypothetical protein